MCSLYWCCGNRRRYLKHRVGKDAFRNVYQVSRNVFFMLRRDDLELYGDVKALERGCVLYSCHFGVWELMPYALRKLGYRIGIISNRYGDNSTSSLVRLFDSILKHWRSINGVTVFYKENALEIARFIKSGGIFGILVDGNTLFQKYEKARKLAYLCKVRLVPFAAYRKGTRGVLKIGCDLPRLVRTMPLDYMWFYRSR
jgi:lauroyl/myristoyl acyltransferase